GSGESIYEPRARNCRSRARSVGRLRRARQERRERSEKPGRSCGRSWTRSLPGECHPARAYRLVSKRARISLTIRASLHFPLYVPPGALSCSLRRRTGLKFRRSRRCQMNTQTIAQIVFDAIAAIALLVQATVVLAAYITVRKAMKNTNADL